MSSTPENPIPRDHPPSLSEELTDAEWRRAVTRYLEGPPRLLERIERLEVIVTTNKQSAGENLAMSGLIQDDVNRGFTERIAELFGITAGLQKTTELLQNASLRLFVILSLFGAVAIYIGSRAIG